MLRGDIVKDDSGSHSVFAEQGSSASQTTAANAMDVIARLPGCDGQAADAVPALHSGKIGGNSQIAPNFRVRMSRRMETSFPRHKNGRNPWQTLKILWYFLNEIDMVIPQPVRYGKNKSNTFYLNLDGTKHQIGHVCLFIENKGYCCRYVWMTSWFERSRIWLP